MLSVNSPSRAPQDRSANQTFLTISGMASSDVNVGQGLNGKIFLRGIADEHCLASLRARPVTPGPLSRARARRPFPDTLHGSGRTALKRLVSSKNRENL